MAINENPYLTFGQDLSPEQLAVLRGLVPADFVAGNDPGVWRLGDSKMGPRIGYQPSYAMEGVGDGGDMRPTGSGTWAIDQPRNVSTWGSSDVSGMWDADGKWIGLNQHAAHARDGLRAALAVAGGVYGGLSGAGQTGTAVGGTGSTGGMTGQELATFLEANAGALAPGGEVAAGYGTTWGVGADGIIGSGATMTADGVSLDQIMQNYGAEGGTGSPNSTPSNTNAAGPTNSTPSTPSGPGNNGGNGSDFTLRDGMKLAEAGVKLAGGLSGNGGGDVGDPDQRLVDAQLRSMDLQSQMLERMIGNADMILPFQKEAMDFGLKTAREAYDDYRADRDYGLGRRALLTQLQDQAVADARSFNTDEARARLRGGAIADATKAFDNNLSQVQRMMLRTGRNGNDGRWGSTVRQLVGDNVLAQTGAANRAEAQARAEGRMLTDRAMGSVAGAPQIVANATGSAAGAGASGVPLTDDSSRTMQGTLQSVGSLAGQLGTNATSMYGQQARTGGGGGGGTDWSAAGAVLAGLTKAYDAFNKG